MSNIEYKKEHINMIQKESLEKTREIIRMLDESRDAGTRSLTMLNEQYEKLERANNLVESTNKNLEISSDILGRIKHFFFPRRACNINKLTENIPDNRDDIDVATNNISNTRDTRNKSFSIKSEFLNQDAEAELDNNLDKINHGISNLKNIALTMNSQLDEDAKLLERVSTKSEIVNTNIKKLNKEIIKVL